MCHLIDEQKKINRCWCRRRWWWWSTLILKSLRNFVIKICEFNFNFHHHYHTDFTLKTSLFVLNLFLFDYIWHDLIFHFYFLVLLVFFWRNWFISCMDKKLDWFVIFFLFKCPWNFFLVFFVRIYYTCQIMIFFHCFFARCLFRLMRIYRYSNCRWINFFCLKKVMSEWKKREKNNR